MSAGPNENAATGEAAVTRSSFWSDLKAVLAERDFRKLFAARLVSQTGDGVFNAGFAAYAFFSAQSFPNPAAAVYAFTVLYVPYSLIGPFAGVFIDRWSRRQIIVYGALIRSVMVAVAGVRRARRSDRRASLRQRARRARREPVLPQRRLRGHTARGPRRQAGDGQRGGADLGDDRRVRRRRGGPRRPPGDWRRPAGSAATLWFAGACYIVAALLGTRLAKDMLGPFAAGRKAAARARSSLVTELGDVFRGLVAGLRHLNERRRAAYALGAVGVHRALYGTLLVQALLLYRNYFYSGGNGNKALGSATLLVITSAVGFGLAALLTPEGVKRLTKDQWIALWLLIGGVVTILLGPTFDKYTYLVVGFALGLSAQCVKICVDTTVQQTVDDAYMGRVFSLYDMLYNVAFVIGPAIAIPFLPETGKSYPVVLAIGACYVAASAVYAMLTIRNSKGAAQSPPARPTQAAQR